MDQEDKSFEYKDIVSGEESWSDEMADMTRDFALSDLCLGGSINSF